LKHSCLITSLILLVQLVLSTFLHDRPSRRKENWIPVYSVLILLLALVLDACVADTPQPVSFLTISIVISSVLYYIWLHFQFVRAHENALAAEQRIQIMMTQIQPHFLYNTLATIRSLCMRSPETAARTIDRFSKYLRQNLDTLNQPELIPFSQELEHVKIYTEIEMLMFPYIHIHYDIGDDCFMLPPLTVQPLVENAIRHGVRAREIGQIDIIVRKGEDGHTIVIADNGLGFDPAAIDAAEGRHIGISNVRERLEKQCGGTLVVESRQGEGTTVTVFIPAAEKDDKRARQGGTV
jgi:LytS/YehU family sensor histidine kinase